MIKLRSLIEGYTKPIIKNYTYSFTDKLEISDIDNVIKPLFIKTFTKLLVDDAPVSMIIRAVEDFKEDVHFKNQAITWNNIDVQGDIGALPNKNDRYLILFVYTEPICSISLKEGIHIDTKYQRDFR